MSTSTAGTPQPAVTGFNNQTAQTELQQQQIEAQNMFTQRQFMAQRQQLLMQQQQAMYARMNMPQQQPMYTPSMEQVPMSMPQQAMQRSGSSFISPQQHQERVIMNSSPV